MFQDVDVFDHHEQSLFRSLETAQCDGLASATGHAAFSEAMTALDRLVDEREEHLYSPLAADPLTRDYISRLDGQIHGLSSRIDILRTHIELGLMADSDNRDALDASLHNLIRQLRTRFRREAALIPVYAGWLDRTANSAAAAVAAR
ncbi:hypothetical protein [Maricaulis maris]|uniref:Hemerythrin HHE cation binding domain-containing protein n=1 Tax=Maricaulis maris TaxID=74318 RepID=A0A495DL71_9PROT|nr:hypothetical protein [Maricaulis maris]RKR03683.1 hypothetical protein C7435_0120 [Maricaulis maris]